MVNRILVARVIAQLHHRGFDIDREQLVFGASHTHSGYGGYSGKLVEILSVGWPRADVLDELVDAMSDAIAEALTHRVPAELATCAKDLSLEHLVTNRIDASLPTNDWLDLMSVRRTDTKAPLATVAIFIAHATCHSSHDHRVSADYPGVLCEWMERTFDAPCLFFAGSVGSMKPSDFGKNRSLWSRWLGCVLALDAVTALQKVDHYRSNIPLGSVGIELKLPAAQMKWSRDWRLSPLIAGSLCPTLAYFQSARIDDRMILATPCDFSGQIALSLAILFPGSLPSSPALMENMSVTSSRTSITIGIHTKPKPWPSSVPQPANSF